MSNHRYALAGVLGWILAGSLTGCASLDPSTAGPAPVVTPENAAHPAASPQAARQVIRGQQPSAGATSAGAEQASGPGSARAQAAGSPREQDQDSAGTIVRGQNPPGSYPPGSYPPGSYPPGSYPPGSYPPSGSPYGGGVPQPSVPPNYPAPGVPPAYPPPGGQPAYVPPGGQPTYAPAGSQPTYPTAAGQAPAPFTPPAANGYVGPIPPAGSVPYTLPAPAGPGAAGPGTPPPASPLGQPDYFGPPVGAQPPLVGTPVPIDVYVQEARTGRFMLGVGVNSDAGVTGQIVIDERNFDIARIPTSWDDIANGTAFRGAGQGFRIEAMPGNQVQRYLVSFTEPYLFDTPVSLNLSGFLFDRRFFDWDEQRLGGRVSLGYRLSHDLSLAAAVRMENVNIHDPRVTGVPELDNVLGDNELYSGRLTLTHDTRDVPFFPTEGHLIELAFEQAFGTFDYPRGELDIRKYFLLRERPDGSGRHTLATGIRMGVSGAQTPIYENYFAGGFSTLRGFEFRGASPVDTGVTVGGQLQLLGSVEYFFPITADDMLKGVFFCDFGTVERDIEILADNFRVAPGFGLRIAVPALGPAPLALDFAFPVAHAETDQIQNFSFFIGVGRS